MLKMAVPFVLGLVLAQAWPMGFTVHAVVVICAVVVFGWVAYRRSTYRMRWTRGAAMMLTMASLGGLFYCVRCSPDRPGLLSSEDGERKPLVVSIAEVTGLSPNVVRCKATALGWWRNDALQPVEGGVLLMIRSDSASMSLAPGDRIMLKAPIGTIDRVADPGGFDRARWAAAQGIGYEAFVEGGNWVLVGHEDPFFGFFEGWRSEVAGWFDGMRIGESQKGLVKALILGVRNDIGTEQRDAFARSGTMHVLAVSGMHVGLIYWILSKSLLWLGNRRMARWGRGILVLTCLWLFAGLAGGSPSIVRAAIMFSVFTIADSSGRPSEPLNSIGFAALVLLLWDPSMLWQLGFQLSFLAVLGIIVFYKPLMGLWSPSTFVAHYLWSAVCVTLAAQVATTPVSMLAFGAFPTWFLPANLVVVLASTVAIYLGLFALLVQVLGSFREFVEMLLGWAVAFMGNAAQWFGTLPLSYPAVRIDAWQCSMLYVLILVVPAAIKWRWRAALWAIPFALVVTFVRWHDRLDHRDERTAVVVYDFRDGVLCSFVHGRTIFVQADSAALGSSMAERKTLQHSRAWGLSEVSDRYSVSDSIVTWTLPKLSALMLKAGSSTTGTREVPDVLILHGEGKVDMARTTDGGIPDAVVLCADMSMDVRRYVRYWCQDHNVLCHDIRRQGAFILQR